MSTVKMYPYIYLFDYTSPLLIGLNWAVGHVNCASLAWIGRFILHQYISIFYRCKISQSIFVYHYVVHDVLACWTNTCSEPFRVVDFRSITMYGVLRFVKGVWKSYKNVIRWKLRSNWVPSVYMKVIEEQVMEEQWRQWRIYVEERWKNVI